MLKHLFVSNYALIDELSLDFDSGLTIITGETGAGKSILLGALRLVLGERADQKSVKNQDQKCVIEAHFDIAKLNLEPFFEANDLDYDAISILRREILPSGKSRAFINDIPVVLPVLNDLSSKLIDIHSQFETAELLKTEFQFNWIDIVANQTNLLLEFRNQLAEYHRNKSELLEIKNRKIEFEKEMDYNTFLFEELEQAQLENIEITALEDEQYQLENAEEIAANLSESIQFFDGEEFGIISGLNKVSSISKHFSTDLQSRIEAVKIEAKDIKDELNIALENLEINPSRLVEVQQTLNKINNLLQKHHALEVNDLIDIREDLNKKLEANLNLDIQISNLKKEIERLEIQLNTMASQISKNRQKVIPEMQLYIANAMSQLGMPNTRLAFNLEDAKDFNLFGKNTLDLKFSANKGIDPKSIDKAVSGGERSRLMLAVKEYVAKNQALPTLILDEIDTGVSGKIAESVGAIMFEASKNLQIIAITHLPQVAAYGHQHLKVKKSIENGTTLTLVTRLNKEERIQEIAQMLSGKNISNAAIEQAKQLLKIT